MRLTRIIFTLLLILPASPRMALAVDESRCAAPSTAPPLAALRDDQRDTVNISADSSLAGRDELSLFSGNVIIEQAGLRITTDNAEYDAGAQRIQLTGHVRLDSSSLQLTAKRGDLNVQDSHSTFSGVEYKLANSGLRGRAGDLHSSGTISTMQQAMITSCNPDDLAWRLNADDLILDHAEAYGYAHDVVLRFKEVPFFYTPYIEFPTGERRRSGLLIPSFGNSTSRGFEFAQPWYWNIASNHDAILAPHFMARRGTQLDTQYRFLTASSKGQLDAAYLQHDALAGDGRHQLRYVQHTRIAAPLNFNLDVEDVSDTDYFNDFSNDITGSSTTHLNRSAQLVYARDALHAQLFAQTYETVDISILPADRPYRRLPQLSVQDSTRIAATPLHFSIAAEWTAFDHEDASRIVGNRSYVKPELSLPLRGSYWFATPAVSASFTRYDIATGSGSALAVDNRSLGSSHLDAGLLFERDASDGLTQTLEPRLYYLHTAFEDQSALPIFDTSVPDFNVAQLFRDNSFNGYDRIADANQLTLALSSRLIRSSNGDELLRASLGQIVYFDDRKVTLSGPTLTRTSSDLIAELGTRSNHWRSTASLQWDNERRRSSKQNFLLHYRSDQRAGVNTRIFNIGYRMRDADSISPDAIEQSDISIVTPIAEHYALFARWNYSIPDKRDIDVIGGLMYDSCCWSVQMLAQRRLNNSNASSEYDNAVMLQLVLKGLGSVSGNQASDTLSRAILGYRQDTL